MSPTPTASLWTCPLCQEALVRNASQKLWACAHGHSFDRAREGYVNLLPANKKHSGDPGDNTEMIAARRHIHAADIYRPLANAVLTQLTDQLPLASVLDLGCGEGYYADVLQRAMPAQICGVDISRAAVRLASKRYPGIDFAVASAFKLPLASASQGAVVRIFAPSDDSEVVRVLKPGGLYLEVTPAPRHLWALREALYDTPRVHADSRDAIAGLALREGSSCEFDVELDQPLLRALLAMTPFAHRGHREKRERLQNRDGIQLGMAFTLRLFQKTDTA